MRRNPKSSDSKAAVPSDVSPLLNASFQDSLLTDVLVESTIKNASSEQIDMLISRVIPLPQMRMQFINTASEIWSKKESVRGDFRLRLLQGLRSQSTRLAFAELKDLAGNVEAFADIYCSICKKTSALAPLSETQELLALGHMFAKAADRLNDVTSLDWNIREHLAALRCLEVTLRLIPENTRASTKDLESIGHFVKSRCTISDEPTNESIATLNSLWKIGELLLHVNFSEAILPSLMQLLEITDRYSEEAVRERFGAASPDQKDFSRALDSLVYRGLKYLHGQAATESATPLWLKVLKVHAPESREVAFAIHALIQNEPRAVHPYLKDALLSVRRGKSGYHEALMEALNLEEGARELRKVLCEFPLVRQLECLDSLERLLDTFEDEIFHENLSIERRTHFAPAMAELRKLVGRPG